MISNFERYKMNQKVNVRFELVSKSDEKTKQIRKHLRGETILDNVKTTIYINPCKEKKKQTSPDYTMSYQIEGNRTFVSCGLLWNKVGSQKNPNLKFKSGIFKYDNKGYNMVIFQDTREKTIFNAIIDFDQEVKPKSNIQQTNESSPF